MSSRVPFIFRSQPAGFTDGDFERHKTLVSQLSPEELERVSGATNQNNSSLDISPSDWDNDSGIDHTTRNDD